MPERKRRTSITKRRAPFLNGKRILAAKILGVPLGETFPLFRQVIQRENRRHRTDGYAGPAINTLYRIDVQHFLFRVCRRILLGMNTIHRTGIYARGVLGADTRFCNYVCHKICVPLRCEPNLTEPHILTRMPTTVQHADANVGAWGRISTPPPTPAPRWVRIRRYARPRRWPLR